MGVYWTRPFAYLSLDSRNRWYTKNVCELPNELRSAVAQLGDAVPCGAEYPALCRAFARELGTGKYDCGSLPALSDTAFVVSEETNGKNREAKENGADEVLGDAGVMKTRYWLYSPGKESCLWDRLSADGEMAIGWEGIGGLSMACGSFHH